MSTMQPAIAAIVYEAETPGDVLVEALAMTSAEADPFNQGAQVAHYLWERGIVITRSSSSIKLIALRAIIWGGIGAGVSRLLRAATENDPIWPLVLGWITLVAVALALLYFRSSKSLIQPFD